MPHTENEWFSFVLGFGFAFLIIVGFLLTLGPIDRKYCPTGFDKSHLVLYEDHTWACTNGSQEQMVK